MPRAIIDPKASQLLADMVVYRMEQAIYAWPAGASNSHLALVESSIKFIAIPPITSPSYSNQFGAIGPASGPSKPSGVQLYSDVDVYFSFNSTTNTRVGAFLPAGVLVTIPMNPGLPGASTISFCGVLNTAPFRANWVLG